MNINYTASASFDPENARQLGIPAALLLDKIIRLSKVTPRDDGFCWYTAKQFEDETSLTRCAFNNATKKLVEAGVIEKKVTYIIGTTITATHFKLARNAENGTPECTRGVHIGCTPEVHSVNTINYNEQKDVRKRTSSESINNGNNSSPFDDKTDDESVSLKPQNKNKENAAAAILAGEMVDLMPGHDKRETKYNGVVANIKKLLARGYSRDEMLYLAKWATTDDFYKDKPLSSIISADAIQKAMIAKKEDDRLAEIRRKNRDDYKPKFEAIY